MILWWVNGVRGIVIDTNSGTVITVKEAIDTEENKVHLSIVVTTTTGPHIHEITVKSEKPVVEDVVEKIAALLPSRTSVRLDDIVKAVAEMDE